MTHCSTARQLRLHQPLLVEGPQQSVPPFASPPPLSRFSAAPKNMWITPTLLLLLAYILVSASPISAPYETTANDNPVQIAKRGASVVHFSRSPTIAHDSSSTSVRIAQADRKILRFKFGKNTKKVTKIAHKIGSWIWRRAIKETAKPFDVKERRNGLKGTDSLSSEWAGFDVCES